MDEKTAIFQFEIKSALRGCLEIPVFLKIGATRFSGTLPAVKRSFIILAFLLVISTFIFPEDEKFADKSFLWSLGLLSLNIVLSMIAYMATIYFLKPNAVTKDQFWQFVSAYNWLGIPALIIHLPFVFLAVSGLQTWDDVYPMMGLLIIYTYAFQAFFITHLFKTTWYMGIAFTIIDLLIGEIGGNISEFLMTKLF